jgi:dihydrofolate reductase
VLISIIAALDEGGGIGFENNLPWRLSEDLKRFKRLTMGHHLILGRVTFDSIGHALPGRKTVVVSRNSNLHYDDVDVVSTLEEALELAKGRGEDEAFIGGGADIYRLALPIADRVYLTRVHAQVDADVFFPEFDLSDWVEVSRQQFGVDEVNQFPTTYLILER